MHSFPTESSYEHFLIELRAAREAAHLTQQALADRLQVHQTLISKSETGGRRLDIVELRTWLAALGIPLTQFVAQLEGRLDRHKEPATASKRVRTR